MVEKTINEPVKSDGNTFWNRLAEQAGGQLISSLGSQANYWLGELTGYNDRLKKDQLEQTKNLGDIQQSFNFESMDKAYEMNSPENQVKRLQAAGLNPALIYGQGGNSGGTVQALGIDGGRASSESERKANDIAIQGMAIQMAKMQSEIELNQATAENLRSNVPLNQAKTESQQLQNNFDKIRNKIKLATTQQEIDGLIDQFKNYYYEGLILVNKGRITQVEANNNEKYGERQFLAGILKLEGEAALSEEQADMLLETMNQNWEKLEIDREKNTINREALENALKVAGINQDSTIYGALINAGGKVIGDIIDVAKWMKGVKGGKAPTSAKGNKF